MSLFPVLVKDIKIACKNAKAGIILENIEARKKHDKWYDDLKKTNPISSRIMFRKRTEEEWKERDEESFYQLNRLVNSCIVSSINQYAQLAYWDIKFVEKWVNK